MKPGRAYLEGRRIIALMSGVFEPKEIIYIAMETTTDNR